MKLRPSCAFWQARATWRGAGPWVGPKSFTRFFGSGALAVFLLLPAFTNFSAAQAEPLKEQWIDRVVVRFSSPDTGGVSEPRFIFERELSFEARLQALADVSHRGRREAFLPHHARAALERHLGEELLSVAPLSPPATEAELSHLSQIAREYLERSVGGEQALEVAMREEGFGALELRSLLRRRARAGLYLDRMVSPMLSPSPLSLRRFHREVRNPYSGRPLASVEAELSRYFVAQSLERAVLSFFQSARNRITIVYY